MNDEPPRGATRRWWARPTLARLAFGAETIGSGGTPTALANEWLFGVGGETLKLDLDDPAQREFGDYELLEQIGQGGMGVVYRARQRSLGREVAIKLLSAGPWASPEFVARFQQEAQHAAQLQHPAIVTVFEMGELDGLVYYAMQLVRGESLAQHLEHRGGRLAERDAATMMRTVAEAVAYAHSLGVLHLDLKPGNILLDESGRPRVADFGLARSIDPGAHLDNEYLAGTPGYMAPEQAVVGTQALTPATDVWGLGAILYELLCGQPPFAGADLRAALQSLQEGVVSRPSGIAPVSADLEAICLKCLQKAPADRYPDARALADDLDRYLEGRAVSVRPLDAAQRTLRWARREPLLAGTACLALLALLAGIIATSLQWRRAENNAATSSARLWESRREAALRLEQDGKGYEAIPRLLQNIEEQERGGRGDLAALDRRRLGMLVAQGAVLIDTVAIADANPMAVELSDDGSLLAIAFNDQSVRWYDTATLRERGRASLQGRLSANGEPRTPLLLRFVGNHRLRVTLEWISNLVSPSDSDTWLIDLERKAVVEPPVGFADFADAAYSADGRHALLRNHDRKAQLWQVAPWKPLSTLSMVTGSGKGLADYFPMQVGPDAGYVALLRPASREMLWFTPPDMARARSIRFPGDAGISSWGHSRDGRWLALGDLEGRVFLMDTRTRALRTLPTSRGREITWLAFSEDDAWLAAASHDGLVYAFDVERGDSLVTGQMRHDFILRRVGLSHSHRLLIAAGEGQSALWRLPEPGPRAVPAQRIGAGPAAHGLAGQYPVSWSLQAGLLASAGMDGRVRLWRLPLSPMLPARAARQIAETLQFDGRRLVDVEWNQLRLVSVDRTSATRWIALAQPPGFAELVDGGRTLLATVGPQLRIYDAPSLRLRFPPLALPDSPQRLLASDDGAQVLLGFAGSGGSTGLQERLQRYDLRTGRRLPGEVTLDGPLRMLALSANGSRLLAIGPPEGATTLFATDGMRKLADYPHDPFQPVVRGAFANDGRDLWLVSAAGDPRLGSDALLRWNPNTDEVQQSATGKARPKAVIATARGMFVAGNDQDMLASEGPDLRRLERSAISEAAEGLAASADGRLVARAFRREVQVYDAASGASVGPPLQSDSNAMDRIDALAFSTDAHQLLARTRQGRWLVWSLRPDARPVQATATRLSQLDLANEDQQQVLVPAAAERARLRAEDPGRWLQPPPRPAVPVQTSALVDRSPVPARAPGTSPLLLDLGRFYASGPDGVRNRFFTVRSQMRPYPAGVQRFGGIDYDMRGMAEIGTIEWVDPLAMPLVGAHCIPVPQELAAVHLLLLPVVVIATLEPQTLARLTWHYQDGSEATSPLRTQHELPGYAGLDRKVPLVFSTTTDLTADGTQSETVSGPRLRNPHPGRAVRCIDLETTGQPVLLFAITVEPAPERPSVGPPVIPTTVSRIDQ